MIFFLSLFSIVLSFYDLFLNSDFDLFGKCFVKLYYFYALIIFVYRFSLSEVEYFRFPEVAVPTEG